MVLTISQEFLDTACVSTDWTDEKHSLYLKSMEASFVDQLYGSMGLLDQGAENQNPLDQRSRHRHGSPYSPSGQVLQTGFLCFYDLVVIFNLFAHENL